MILNTMQKIRINWWQVYVENGFWDVPGKMYMRDVHELHNKFWSFDASNRQTRIFRVMTPMLVYTLYLYLNRTWVILKKMNFGFVSMEMTFFIYVNRYTWIDRQAWIYRTSVGKVTCQTKRNSDIKLYNTLVNLKTIVYYLQAQRWHILYQNFCPVLHQLLPLILTLSCLQYCHRD